LHGRQSTRGDVHGGRDLALPSHLLHLLARNAHRERNGRCALPAIGKAHLWHADAHQEPPAHVPHGARAGDIACRIRAHPLVVRPTTTPHAPLLLVVFLVLREDIHHTGREPSFTTTRRLGFRFHRALCFPGASRTFHLYGSLINRALLPAESQQFPTPQARCSCQDAQGFERVGLSLWEHGMGLLLHHTVSCVARHPRGTATREGTARSAEPASALPQKPVPATRQKEAVWPAAGDTRRRRERCTRSTGMPTATSARARSSSWQDESDFASVGSTCRWPHGAPSQPPAQTSMGITRASPATHAGRHVPSRHQNRRRKQTDALTGNRRNATVSTCVLVALSQSLPGRMSRSYQREALLPDLVLTRVGSKELQRVLSLNHACTSSARRIASQSFQYSTNARSARRPALLASRSCGEVKQLPVCHAATDPPSVLLSRCHGSESRTAPGWPDA